MIFSLKIKTLMEKIKDNYIEAPFNNNDMKDII